MHGAPEVVVAMGTHRHWTGKMHCFSDGKFFVVKRQGKNNRGSNNQTGFSKDSDKAGMWQLNGDKLMLLWFKWNTEDLEDASAGSQRASFSSKEYPPTSCLPNHPTNLSLP